MLQENKKNKKKKEEEEEQRKGRLRTVNMQKAVSILSFT
jgi:hypothetical protein